MRVRNILIVDDDADIQALFQKILDSKEFCLRFAGNSDVALSNLEMMRFDLIFLDVFLGEYETALPILKYLRENSKTTPLILMSARIDDKHEQKFKGHSVQVIEVLREPFLKGDIRMIIRRFLAPRVLVLEDDLDILNLFKLELKKSGYIMDLCRSVERAKTQVDRGNIICFFMDIFIGSAKTSMEMLELFMKREVAGLINPPLVIMSSSLDEGRVERFEESGMVYKTLPKPFSRKKITKLLNSIESIDSSDDDLNVSSEPSLEEKANIVHGAIVEEQSMTFVKGEVSEDDYFTRVKGRFDEPSLVKKIRRLSKDDEIKNVNQRNSEGLTKLMGLAMMGDYDGCHDAISSGAEIRAKSKNGKTALHYAAGNGDQAVVSLLIEHGAKVNERDNDGVEPLFEALRSKNKKLIQLLIEKGARIQSRVNGRSYLMLAALLGDIEIVKLFAGVGISPKLKDFSGKTAMQLAMKKKNLEVARYLKEWEIEKGDASAPL